MSIYVDERSDHIFMYDEEFEDNSLLVLYSELNHIVERLIDIKNKRGI